MNALFKQFWRQHCAAWGERSPPNGAAVARFVAWLCFWFAVSHLILFGWR